MEVRKAAAAKPGHQGYLGCTELAEGLTLFEGLVDASVKEELLLHVESWLGCGRAGTLAGKGYQLPPQEWVESGQSREMLQFGVHVRCNKVRTPSFDMLLFGGAQRHVHTRR